MTKVSRKKSTTELVKKNDQHTKRAAGVLLHITSLPSAFGIGDLGPEAFAFANFLKAHNQTYWQILPLTITSAEQQHSPYSAMSCMAGNILLISPELLVKDKLLTTAEINKYRITNTGKVNFSQATEIKKILLENAYRKFAKTETKLHDTFKKFIKKENFWLHDYACYVILKNLNNQSAWFKWEDKYKLHKAASLKQFDNDYKEEIKKEKWFQFIFFKQWNELKDYLQKKEIKIFGDLPFYVSHDSADVWANPKYFSLKADGQLQGVAGVPPDYFNDNGQLWGMPVFRWDVLQKNNYDWWISRIKKNMELYDLLRFDHFRAFADYWEVSASEKTAKFGMWKKGPGSNLFNHIKSEFPSMPFVAEDLGDIDESVHQLRDNFNLPGMKVLQFAFGDNLPTSDHITHNFKNNFVVYTGTHDNNTTCGWFKENHNTLVVKNLEKYFRKKITKSNVHLELINQAYASVARIAIIPMQDLLGLDERARINTPASINRNWVWRVTNDQVKKVSPVFNEWVTLFNRK